MKLIQRFARIFQAPGPVFYGLNTFLFLALMMAYLFFRRGNILFLGSVEGFWLLVGVVKTLAMVLSMLSVAWSWIRLRQGRWDRYRILLGQGLALGVLIAVIDAVEWRGYYTVLSGSFFNAAQKSYGLIWMWFNVHLMVGLVWGFYHLFYEARLWYNHESSYLIKNMRWTQYWQFVSFLWMFIVVFLYGREALSWIFEPFI